MSGPINPDTIVFDAPAQFTDDTPIPANTLVRYEYIFAQAASGPFTKVVADVDFTPNAQGRQTAPLDLAGFAFGQWFAAVRAVSKDGPVSASSNVAPFEVQAKVPKPPTGFSLA